MTGNSLAHSEEKAGTCRFTGGIEEDLRGRQIRTPAKENRRGRQTGEGELS